MFKLCMCDVDKCKVLTMGTCNFEVVLSFIDILNSNPIIIKIKIAQNTLKTTTICRIFSYPCNSYVYSPFELCKSDQHPGIALILTILPQRHIGEYSGVRVNQPGEMTAVCIGVPLLLQIRKI